MKGKLDMRNPAQVEAHIRQIRGLAKIVEQNPKMKSVYNFAYEKYSKQRSVQQNRYYRGPVIECFVQEWGWLPTEVHEHLTGLFLPKKQLVMKSTGQVIEQPMSTTELNTAQWEEFMEQVRIYAISEHNIYIPMPNEYVEASP
jgi:hypothetical protein